MTDEVTVLLGALAVDLFLGEPPAAIHPVVWIGKLQTVLRRRAPARPPAAFAYGVVMAAAGPIVFGGGASWLLAHLHGLLGWIVAVWLLKSAFAVRELAAAALRVRRGLVNDDLAAARGALTSLVSRDVTALAPSLVAAAAIESVAENCADSIIAPLAFYVVGGVPAALAYRAINTLDAMIGYRGPLEWLGKAAARLDDVANIVPARMAALLLAAAAPLGGGSVSRAFRTWARDRRSTASPNAGHPMAAMAGALGVRLEKPQTYVLGRELRLPNAADVLRAVRVMAAAAVVAAILTLMLARGPRAS